jgi:hypothetical protein
VFGSNAVYDKLFPIVWKIVPRSEAVFTDVQLPEPPEPSEKNLVESDAMPSTTGVAVSPPPIVWQEEMEGYSLSEQLLLPVPVGGLRVVLAP